MLHFYDLSALLNLNTINVGFYWINYEIRKASKRTPPSILIVYHLLDHAPPPNLANVGIAIISFSYSGVGEAFRDGLKLKK